MNIKDYVYGNELEKGNPNVTEDTVINPGDLVCVERQLYFVHSIENNVLKIYLFKRIKELYDEKCTNILETIEQQEKSSYNTDKSKIRKEGVQILYSEKQKNDYMKSNDMEFVKFDGEELYEEVVNFVKLTAYVKIVSILENGSLDIKTKDIQSIVCREKQSIIEHEKSVLYNKFDRFFYDQMTNHELSFIRMLYLVGDERKILILKKKNIQSMDMEIHIEKVMERE